VDDKHRERVSKRGMERCLIHDSTSSNKDKPRFKHSSQVFPDVQQDQPAKLSKST